MHTNQFIPVISFVAKSSGSGKTTLLEKVIKRLKEQGIKVAVVKHDAHQLDIDKPGKDTWKFAQAGADVVAISSPEKVAVMETVRQEKSLDEIIAMLPAVDLVLTEGFKGSNKPKIEVIRSAVQGELACQAQDLLAIASDTVWDIGVPCYHLDDVAGVVGEILRYMNRHNNSVVVS